MAVNTKSFERKSNQSRTKEIVKIAIKEFAKLKEAFGKINIVLESYTVTRRSAEFRHPARMTQDSSCYIGENDCFIWAGNLHPQVPKFSVITGNFRRFLL
jgi:hypothetical protein